MHYVHGRCFFCFGDTMVFTSTHLCRNYKECLCRYDGFFREYIVHEFKYSLGERMKEIDEPLKDSGGSNAELRVLITRYKETDDKIIFEEIWLLMKKKINGLARKICQFSPAMDIDDLVQTGYIELWDSIWKFDATRSENALGYLNFTIERKMWREINNKGFSLDLPVAIRDKLRKMRELTEKFDREITPHDKDAICREMGITAAELVDLQYLSTLMKTGSLDEMESSGDKIKSETDIDKDAFQGSTCEAVFLGSTVDLTSREKEVVTLRYGIGDGEIRSLEQVGKELGVSKQAVAKFEKSALKKLNSSSVKAELCEAIQSKAEARKKNNRAPCE